MNGWQLFADTHYGQPAHYTTVSEQYADYCSEKCKGEPLRTDVPIGDLIEALEGMATS